MSNPSFENIDKWLFEYVEGNLSPKQITQLEAFLLNNPEFEADLDAWQFAKVDASPVEFPGVIGQKRRAVPFWIPATLVLSTVFIAGGLTGAYLSKPASANKKVRIESVAGTNSHTIPNQTKSPNKLSGKSVLASVYNNQGNAIESDGYFIGKTPTSTLPKQTTGSVSSVSKVKVVSPSSKPELEGENLLSFETESKQGSIDLIESSFVKSQNETLEIESDQAINSEIENKAETVPNLAENVMTSKSEDGSENANSTVASEPKSKEPKNEIQTNRSNTAATMTRGERITSNYSNSFSSKVKFAMRKVVRMTENPIALTNSKDVYYHVPGMQTLNVNAATAGNLLRPRIQSVTRAQWTGHSNQQLSNELSFDTYVRSIRGGVGVQVNHSMYDLGSYNVGQVALTYSPKFTVSRNFSIEPAIRVKMGDKRLNAQNLVQGQIIELERGNEKIFFNETPQNLVKDLWYKDIALALNTNTKWFSAGFQMDNLGRHENNIYNSLGQNDRSGIHYTAHFSTDFVSRSKVFSFSPYLMCQKVENLSEIWGGSVFRYNKLTFGGAFSSGGDYAASIGLKTKQFMLTYNADMTNSFLTGTRLFSQQLTIRLLMNKGFYGRTTLKQ